MAKISVLIPAYNASATIKRAVRSCRDADEIIVCDNGSSDDTAKKARAVGATVVNRLANGGFCGGVNTAISAATGNFLVVLGDDDWFEEEALAEMLLALVANQDMHFAYGGTQYHGRRSDEFMPAPFKATDFQRHFAANYAFMFRREALEKCAFRFELEPGVGYPDWDFVLQMLAQGWHGVNVQSITLNHILAFGRGSAQTQAKEATVWAEFRKLWGEDIGR